MVRPCGQSARSEIALTTHDDLVVQLHRSAAHSTGPSTSPRSTALYPRRCHWPGRRPAAGDDAFRNSRSSSSLISIQAPKSGRRAVRHACVLLIGREISRLPAHHSGTVALLRCPSSHGLAPRHPSSATCSGRRSRPGRWEQTHPDWFPFVTKTSPLISLPPRPDSVTTAVDCAADVACLHAAGGGYSRQLCLSCRASAKRAR